MFGYIYLTTNLVNGKKYVGMHKSSEFDPDYKGSGKLLIKAFKKYGYDNFETIILEKCDSLEELSDCEEKWISNLHCVESPDYYNMKQGGYGGYKINGVSIKRGVKISEQARINTSNAHKGKTQSDAFKKMKSDYWKTDANPAKHYTEEDIRKMSEYRKGKIWVTNGEYDKNIKPEELDDYLSKGFRRGRCSARGKINKTSA